MLLTGLFEPFYRSPGARRLGRPGVGLGLSVVQRIAAASGGTVSVESVPGAGSRFVLSLPEAAPPPHGLDRPATLGQVAAL